MLASVCSEFLSLEETCPVLCGSIFPLQLLSSFKKKISSKKSDKRNWLKLNSKEWMRVRRSCLVGLYIIQKVRVQRSQCQCICIGSVTSHLHVKVTWHGQWSERKWICCVLIGWHWALTVHAWPPLECLLLLFSICCGYFFLKWADGEIEIYLCQ